MLYVLLIYLILIYILNYIIYMFTFIYYQMVLQFDFIRLSFIVSLYGVGITDGIYVDFCWPYVWTVLLYMSGTHVKQTVADGSS